MKVFHSRCPARRALVKEFRPNMPVIIASGFAGMITEENYDKARIDEVISKPYAVADVLMHANMILARERAIIAKRFWSKLSDAPNKTKA